MGKTLTSWGRAWLSGVGEGVDRAGIGAKGIEAASARAQSSNEDGFTRLSRGQGCPCYHGIVVPS